MKLEKVLIIEDASIVVETLSLALEMRWPDVKIISTAHGIEGVSLVEKESPDAVILDLGLPDISGFQVLKQIRAFSNIPILILSAKVDESDIVKGLEWGADEYLIKPFRQLELLARLQAMLRRQKDHEPGDLIVGQLRLNPINHQLMLSGREIRVTRTEGLILEHLMRNAGNVVTHASLAEAIWGTDYPDAEKSIKVHMYRLREKLKQDDSQQQFIFNKPGIGYYIAKKV